MTCLIRKGRKMQDFNFPTGYEVYWEKWVDPYEQQIESLKLEIEEKNDSIQDQDQFGFESYDSFSEQEEGLDDFKTIPTIFTPFGLIPLSNETLASNSFKFWVGHTNFKITRHFRNLISSVEGVESLDVFSPYRFKISVGRLFRDRDVMSNIRKVMLSYARLSNEQDQEG
jgi:hypothetical protein